MSEAQSLLTEETPGKGRGSSTIVTELQEDPSSHHLFAQMISPEWHQVLKRLSTENFKNLCEISQDLQLSSERGGQNPSRVMKYCCTAMGMHLTRLSCTLKDG